MRFRTSRSFRSLDSTSRFDLFVAGDIYGNGTVNIGSQAYPANMRVYVGGKCKSGSASCSQNGGVSARSFVVSGGNTCCTRCAFVGGLLIPLYAVSDAVYSCAAPAPSHPS